MSSLISENVFQKWLLPWETKNDNHLWWKSISRNSKRKLENRGFGKMRSAQFRDGMAEGGKTIRLRTCSQVKKDWFICTINDDARRKKKKSFNPFFSAHRRQNARNFFSLLAWRLRRILLWNESFLDASFRVAYVFFFSSPPVNPYLIQSVTSFFQVRTSRTIFFRHLRQNWVISCSFSSFFSFTLVFYLFVKVWLEEKKM